MNFNFENAKYEIKITSKFKNDYKKIVKQNQAKQKLICVLEKLANKEPLEEKYRDHQLINDKSYKECRECHITPDMLLIYKYENNNLVLLLFRIGSHSNLFN